MTAKRVSDVILPPTPFARQFVRLLRGFVVGVPLGLAPLLGYVKIPGYIALVELLPPQLRASLLPIGGIVMAFIAAFAQFYSEERVARGIIRRRFFIAGVTFVVALLLLMVLDTEFVVRLPADRGRVWMTVLIGPSRIETCGCPKEMEDETCVRKLSTSEEAISSCWGRRPRQRAGLALRLSYLLVMGSLAAMVGLIAVQLRFGRGADASAGTRRAPPRRKARRPRQQKTPEA